MYLICVYVPRVEGAPGLVCLAAGREAVADMVTGAACLLAWSLCWVKMKGPFYFIFLSCLPLSKMLLDDGTDADSRRRCCRGNLCLSGAVGACGVAAGKHEKKKKEKTVEE